MDGKGGKNAPRGNRATPARGDDARQHLIRSLYAADPERVPDWLDGGLLSTGEVALLFRVSRRSVTTWARGGKLPFLTTPGGHRRFRAGDVRILLEQASEPRAATRARR